MRKPRLRTVWRSVAARTGAIAAFLIASTLLVPSSTETAVANGDTRTLHLYHSNTHETIDATFRVNGAYDPAVLKQLNWFLRDWRRDEETNMDPRLFDVVWEVYRSAGATDRITVYSGYRSPSTNAMLRRRSRAVAEHSQHMLGKAMDTTMPGMSMEKIREIGMRLQRGGVGYYQTSNFVHLDVGSVRSWPRMSYDQLARLFPDGKTVHIAADGRTLGRYEEARAEIEAGGGAAWAPPAQQSKGFFAWLFGPKDDEDDEEAAQVAAPAQPRGRAQLAAASRAQAQPQPQAVGAPGGVDDSADRNFIIEEARRAARQAPSSVEVAAAAPPQPAPPPQQPQRPAPAAPPAPAKAPVAAEPPPPDPVAVASIPAVLPPRRPVALAGLTPDVPVPPIRPTLVAALEPAAAVARPTDGAAHMLSAKADPIGGLIGATTPAPTPRPRLPVEITQGFSGKRAAAAAPSEVLAYAPTAQIQGLRSAALAKATLPTPPEPIAPGPDVVSARLDRSNFASLTATTATRDVTAQAQLAPTVASLRQSARMVAALFSTELSASGYAARFDEAATDLDASRFTGSATQPLVARSNALFASSALRKD